MKLVRKVSTGVAHSNKALAIYWMKKNPKYFIAYRPSLSMTLESVDGSFDYRTTIRVKDILDRDKIFIEGEKLSVSSPLYKEFVRHTGWLKKSLGIRKEGAWEINVKSTVPVQRGTAGSAARAASIATAAYGLVYEDIESARIRREMSKDSRMGSGSGCRSIHDGFVMWKRGATHDTSYAVQLYPKNYWDIRDIIVLVDKKAKKVPSREGMELTKETAPASLRNAFVGIADYNIAEIRKGLAKKDFPHTMEVYVRENEHFRNICLSTIPPLDYWNKATYNVFGTIYDLQVEGVQAYGGTDAGPAVHVFTLPQYTNKVIEKLKSTEGVLDIIHCQPGGASYLTNEHLL